MATALPGKLLRLARWPLEAEPPGKPGHLWPRWIFLRALALIFFSAFYSLNFQIVGLIGPRGILPAHRYLEAAGQQLGWRRFWYVPSLLWLGSGPHELRLLCWAGLAASVLLFLNLWPRLCIGVCLITYISFVCTAQDFSSYQSDGMLLAAAFLCLFFAPPGLLPGLGTDHPPSRASLFLLQWLWFRIYFESGVVKMASGDPEWRHLTALYQYYSNGPLPDWIGWYAQHLPHSFNAALALLTLVTELGLVWLFFLPRRLRLICFFLVTPFQIGIILTANLAFLNYFVLALGFLLLDDRFLRRLNPAAGGEPIEAEGWLRRAVSRWWRSPRRVPSGAGQISQIGQMDQPAQAAAVSPMPVQSALSSAYHHAAMVISGFLLGWVFYVDTALLLLLLLPKLPLPVSPIAALGPFRISNQYGLFAVMTTARYEIEFQGSPDGKTWTAYPFRYKPQDPRQPPRIYAPYQPRFDWNLWFASLGTWRQYPFVVRTEVLLLLNDPSVLPLFAGNPFGANPPRFVRTVTWQYWFTSLKTMRAEGLWWRRKLLGLYAPVVERLPNGGLGIVQTPEEGSP